MDIGSWTAPDLIAGLSLMVALGSLAIAHQAYRGVKILDEKFTSYIRANHQPVMFPRAGSPMIGRRISDADGPIERETKLAN